MRYQWDSNISLDEMHTDYFIEYSEVISLMQENPNMVSV